MTVNNTRKDNVIIILLKKILDSIANLIIPKEALVRKIEAMNSADFAFKAKSAENYRFSDTKNSKFIRPIFSYHDPLVRTAIWEIKYRGNKILAEKIGQIMYEEIISLLSEEIGFSTEAFGTKKNPAKILLLPVPISKSRRRERGFNQCELLGQAISKIDSGNIFEYREDILIKSKETKKQTLTDDRRERLENLHGSFSVMSNPSVKGKTVIVIDDVSTTGATFGEIRKALRNVGAKKIFCVSIAH